MKEYNIEALWKEDVAPDSQFSLGYLPSAIKSNLNVFSELKRVRNLFWWEWLLEFIAILATVFFLFKSEEKIIVKEIVFSVLYSAVIYYIYISYFVKFIKGINLVPALKIKDAMNSYYDTLCDYITRLRKLALVLLGISIIGSIVEFLLTPDITLGKTIAEIVSLLFGLIFCYAFIDGYFDYMYKDSKTEFEILLRELEDE